MQAISFTSHPVLHQQFLNFKVHFLEKIPRSKQGPDLAGDEPYFQQQGPNLNPNCNTDLQAEGPNSSYQPNSFLDKEKNEGLEEKRSKILVYIVQ